MTVTLDLITPPARNRKSRRKWKVQVTIHTEKPLTTMFMATPTLDLLTGSPPKERNSLWPGRPMKTDSSQKALICPLPLPSLTIALGQAAIIICIKLFQYSVIPMCCLDMKQLGYKWIQVHSKCLFKIVDGESAFLLHLWLCITDCSCCLLIILHRCMREMIVKVGLKWVRSKHSI